MIKKILLTLAITLFSVGAMADSWRGEDKAMHLGVSYVMGFAAINQWPNEPAKAFGVAMIPGVLKEVLDAQKGGTGFSGKDLVADAIGAALGVATGHWLISKQGDKVVVSYRTTFR